MKLIFQSFPCVMAVLGRIQVQSCEAVVSFSLGDPYSLLDSVSVFVVCDIGSEVAETGAIYTEK